MADGNLTSNLVVELRDDRSENPETTGRLCERAAAEIERLTAERDEWAQKAHDWRAKYAELRYPGMKGIVRPADETPPVHPDPTGNSREPPHCPSCSCGMPETNDGGADIRKDSVRQARDTPCDAPSSTEKLPALLKERDDWRSGK